MPIYEYVCRKCHHEFEVLVRGSERPTCPQCGDRKLDKLFSVPAAHSVSRSGPPPCGVDACPARDTGSCCGMDGMPPCGL